jgi:hypothetical protein
LKIRKFQSTSFWNTRWHTKQFSKWCPKKEEEKQLKKMNFQNGKKWTFKI